MADPSNPSISIVVPCRNEGDHIREFLASVRGQDMAGFEWEVIVADGMSTDGTRRVLSAAAREWPRLRVIDNPARTAPCGLNVAIRAGHSDIIVRMDVHTEYAPDYVRRCVAVLLETGATNVGGPARTRARGYVQRAIAAAYHSTFACGGARFHNAKYEGRVDTVPYGCWYRSTLMEAGLFDEDLTHNQDDELNYRLVRGGGTVWQCPQICSWYKPRASLRALWRQYARYGAWKTVVLRKHRSLASVRQVVPAVFATLLTIGTLAALAAFTFAVPAVFAPAVFSLGFLVMSYGVAATGASLSTARIFGWELFPVLPAVFAIYHLAYGTGFIAGLILDPRSSRHRNRLTPVVGTRAS